MVRLRNVETDMAEFEIDREDVHDIDRKKWRRGIKRKSNPIGKQTLNRFYIYI